MAIVASGGRRISPPGPSRWHPGGSVYDRGAGAWSEALGDMAQEVGRRDQEIKSAAESTELTRRAAQYSLDLQGLLYRTEKLQVNNRPATAQEQSDFFKDQADTMARPYLDTKGLSTEASAKINNMIVTATAQRMGDVRQMLRARDLANVEAGGTLAINAAIATNNLAMLHEALGGMVASGAMAQAAADELVKRFPVNVKLSRLEAGMSALQSNALDVGAKTTRLGAYANELEQILTDAELTGKQRDAATSLLNGARANARAIQTGYDRMVADAVQFNNAAMTARVLKTRRGAAKDDEIVLPSEIEARLADPDPARRISEETGRILSNMLTEPKPKNREARLAAYGKVNQAVVDLEGGDIDRDDAKAIYYQNVQDLDEEDAETFLNRIQTGPKDELEAMETVAMRQVEPVFDARFAKANYDEKEAMAKLRAKAHFAKQLRDWAKATYPDGTKVDRAAYQERAVNLLEQQQEAKKTGSSWWTNLFAGPPAGATERYGPFGFAKDQPQATAKASQYVVNQQIQIGGKTYKVTGFDADGEPLIEEVR